MSETGPVFVSIETTAFSGATLLAFLLNTHSQIATIGEMDGLIIDEDPEIYRCSCGQRIKECEFWQSVKTGMLKRGFDFDVSHFNTRFFLNGPRLIQYVRMGSSRNIMLDSLRDKIFQSWPPERRWLKSVVARNVAMIESVLEITGKRIFVDTSKDRLRLRALHHFSNLDTRAIHLTRDVRGFVTSSLRHGVCTDVVDAARTWVKCHEKIELTLARLPAKKRVRVRYEDLCRDVNGALQQLHNFLGAEPEENAANFRLAPHHIVGNPMRLENLSEIKLDERWRDLLSEDQIKVIWQIANKLSERYGYTLSSQEQ